MVGTMSAKRRVAPTCIVMVTAMFVACDGPSLSSTEQLAVVVSTTSVALPDPVEVGKSAMLPRAIRLSPSAGPGSSADAITEIVEACADFTVTGPTPGIVRRQCFGQTTPVEPKDMELPAQGGGAGD